MIKQLLEIIHMADLLLQRCDQDIRVEKEQLAMNLIDELRAMDQEIEQHYLKA